MKPETVEPPPAGRRVEPLVSPIFLYLKSSKIDSKSIKAIESAGYVAIGVDSFDDVRLIEPLPVSLSDGIGRSAMQTIARCNFASVRESFGMDIARKYSSG